MTDNLKSSQGGFWVQLRPDQAPQYFACLDLGDINEPMGDQTLIRCRNADGSYKTVGATQAPPGNVTTDIKALTFPDKDALDLIRRCEVALFALSSSCGRLDDFTAWDRASIVHNARLITKGRSAIKMREADDATMRNLNFSARDPVYDLWKVAVAQQAIAETTNLNDIAMCNALSCGGNCGAFQELGQAGLIGGEAPAGSPASRAEVWQTANGGNNWTHKTGAGVRPFAGGVDIAAVACVALDATTTRWFAVREPVVAEAFKIAYSDDSGATWTVVTLGATNNEGGAGAKCLFAMDNKHLWVCTTAGNVYFSSDGGATWTAEASALTASAGVQLNQVKFADFDNGFAVGNTNTLIQTKDGGSTWTALTGPDNTANLTALEVFTDSPKYHVIVGTSKGGVYITVDGATNWSSKTFSGQATTGTVKALEFSNDWTGFMIFNTATPVGKVYRTIDGGNTWLILSAPSNAGLNALAVVDENNAFAVGNASGGTGIVFKIA